MKLRIAFLSLVVASLFVVACGGGDANVRDQARQAVTANPAPATPAPAAPGAATPAAPAAPAKPAPQPVDVFALQTKLKAKGYYKGPIDGVVGSGTRAALQQFMQNR